MGIIKRKNNMWGQMKIRKNEDRIDSENRNNIIL